MGNKTGRRQRAWGDIAQHRDQRQRARWRRPAPWWQAARRGGQRPQPLSAAWQSNKLREPGQEGAKEVTEAAAVGDNHLKLTEEGPEKHLNGYKVPHLKQNQLGLHLSCLCWLRSGKHRRWKKQSRKDPGVLGRQELISGNAMENLPRGPMVKSPRSQTGGVCSIPGQGTKIAYAVWHPSSKKI